MCYDADGDQTARHVERVQGLEAPTRCAFEVSVKIEEGVDAADMELIIEKVWYEDGTVWRRGMSQMTDYALPAPPDPKRLAILQEIAGRDASVCPSDQGAVWVCVCGRPNPASYEVCGRCQRNKHDIFTRYNEAEIEKILYQRESAEEEKRRQEQEEQRKLKAENEEKARKKRRRRRVWLSVILTVLILAALAVLTGVFAQPIVDLFTKIVQTLG